MSALHPTYKTVYLSATVEVTIDAAVADIQAMQEECQYAASKYPTGHFLAAGYAGAATALRLLNLDFSGVPPGKMHLEVRHPEQVPRRVSHHKARWARATNCASALLAVADTLGEVTDEEGMPLTTYTPLGSAMISTAEKLLAIDFPKLYN